MQLRWIESLLLVLLGICTVLKEDIQHISAELEYGTTLCLPGAFFPDSSSTPYSHTASYVSRLKSEMNKFQAVAPSSHVHPCTHVNPALKTCTHVLVCRDAVHKCLQPPYDGPFQVLKCNNKFYQLDKNGHSNTVSLDRLKPA